MNRRKFLAMMPAGLVANDVLAAAPRRSDARPNFLFMIADDLTYRALHALNNPEVHTPNLDRLAASGRTFTHCFHQGSWSGAVCVPSRTMLNTGLSAFRAQHQADDVQTWSQILGGAGYDTYICGKWHLSEPMLGRSFHEMGPIGPGMLISTPEKGDAYDRPRPGDTWQPDDESRRGHWLHMDVWDGEKPDRVQHSCRLYADKASDFLRSKLAHRSAPFFMYVGFNSPHDPRQSPKEYLDLYPQDKIEIPPNYLPEHPFNQGDFRNRDEQLAPFPRTREAVQLHRREYYALISYLDAQVGRILDALEESGRAQNTYVIFTADHGLEVGEHGLMGKGALYEASVRMPLLIAGPAVTRGSRTDQLVYQHSMFATTCELAGASVPTTVEFPSLVPLLRGGTKPLHDAVFCRYINYQRSVRTTRYKLIVYPMALPHITTQHVQLFDLQSDPWEMKNLVDDPSMAKVKSELWARLKSFQTELDDPLVLQEA